MWGFNLHFLLCTMHILKVRVIGMLNELRIGEQHCKIDVDKSDKNSANNSSAVILVIIIARVITMIVEIGS